MNRLGLESFLTFWIYLQQNWKNCLHKWTFEIQTEYICTGLCRKLPPKIRFKILWPTFKASCLIISLMLRQTNAQCYGNYYIVFFAAFRRLLCRKKWAKKMKITLNFLFQHYIKQSSPILFLDNLNHEKSTLVTFHKVDFSWCHLWCLKWR